MFSATWGLVPTNEVNFAERPLAGIHAKLTKLCDNIVVAMARFPLRERFILVHEFLRKETVKIP